MGIVRRILMRKINRLLIKGDDGNFTGKGVFYVDVTGQLSTVLGSTAYNKDMST
jgi:hypothetical protein